MNRRLAGTAILVLALIGCSGGERIPTAPQPPPPPPMATLEGTIDVTSRLTATGGYEYTIQIHLTERAGVAATITRMDVVALINGWSGPWVSVSGREAWIGDTDIVAANSTLTSKPLTINDESPEGYAGDAEATIRYSDASSSGRQLYVTAPMPPLPGSPSEARVTLNGAVTDFQTGTSLPDVLVKVLNGPDAGRQVTTDANGRFALANLRTGRFELSLTRQDYWPLGLSVFIVADQTMNFRLNRKSTSASPVP